MLTYIELLNTTYFQKDVQVIAGGNGVNQKISWASIVERNDLSKISIKNNELIFSTGISFDNYNSSHEFISKLIALNCSGICIETSLYEIKISQETLDLCDRNDFVVIEAHGILMIGDIIKYINESVMSDEYESFAEGEHFYQKLLEYSHSEDISEIDEKNNAINRRKEHFSWSIMKKYVDFVANYLDARVIYYHILSSPVLSYNTNSSVLSLITDEIIEKLERIDDSEIYVDYNVAITKITVLSRQYSYIFFVFENEVDRHHMYVINRFTRFIRSIVTDTFIKNVKHNHLVETAWFKNWLDGKMSNRAAKDKLKQLKYDTNAKYYYITLINLRNYTFSSNISKDNNNLMSNMAVDLSVKIFRSYLKSGIDSFGHFSSGYLILLSIVPNGIDNFETIIKNALKHVEDDALFNKYKDLRLSIGRYVTDINEIVDSYHTAIFCANMKCVTNKRTLIYKDLGVYRIIEKMINDCELEGFIYDTLGTLLEQSQKELLHILRVYFSCGCSKTKTREKLFMARQTLYNRLKDLEKILGNSFDEGDKRIAIDIALKALEVQELIND